MTADQPRRPRAGGAGEVELTQDGRYVIIGGRRWRATDPAIPDAVAATLRTELMAARRDVKAALRSDDEQAVRRARAKVQRAKEALGERGTPWWELTLEQREARWQPSVPRPH